MGSEAIPGRGNCGAVEPAQTQRLISHPKLPLTKPLLEGEGSATLRSRLEQELGVLSSAGEALEWARRSLPAKNSLSAEDARAVEAAFELRIVSLTAAEGAAPAEVSPENVRDRSVPDHGAPTVESGHHDGLAIPKTPRRRDKKHLRFVASQPCLVCGRVPSDAHHLRFAQPRALGRKVSDEFTVPLCRTHHRQLHNEGNEVAWWEAIDIDPRPVAQQLWNETR